MTAVNVYQLDVTPDGPPTKRFIRADLRMEDVFLVAFPRWARTDTARGIARGFGL